MFSGKTVLERINSDTYMLRDELSFENSKYKVTIKPGLLTDGASIPKVFWSIIGCPLNGKYVGSALIHDGLYASHVLSKEESDLLFLDMMKHNKVSLWRRKLMYWAVKFGGKSSYNGKSAEYIAETKNYVTVAIKGK